jgi:hypothetical protein
MLPLLRVKKEEKMEKVVKKVQRVRTSLIGAILPPKWVLG